jgi:hypothetical protein
LGFALYWHLQPGNDLRDSLSKRRNEMEKETEKEIAIRLYDNPKFGRTRGKGLIHHVVFNGTADLRHPRAKYLLDFLPMEHWQHTARSEDQVECVDAAARLLSGLAAHLGGRAETQFATWIKRLDPGNAKCAVPGFATLDGETMKLNFVVSDDSLEVHEHWALLVKPCRDPASGQRSPHYLASNTELGNW